jgi:hypothetical protein
MTASPFVRAFVGLSCAAILACCVSKPPLPKHASIEHLPKPASDTDFNAVVAGADIIYFPAERAAFGARSEPSALIIEALRQSGTGFAIAWDSIDAAAQPLLDEMQGKGERERDPLIARLDLAGTGRAREHCRAVLRDTRLASVRHIAVRAPAPLVASARAGSLPVDEERRISSGFTPPAGGLELYAERIAGTRGASQADLAGAYRAHVIAQQFAAGQIIDHFSGAGAGGKLLVFLRREDLDAGQGVPHYVSQKLQLRQVILASDALSDERRKLLTGTPGL